MGYEAVPNFIKSSDHVKTPCSDGPECSRGTHEVQDVKNAGRSPLKLAPLPKIE